MMQAADYTARTASVDGIEVVRLADATRHMEVSIVPSVGNLAYEFKIGGRNLLWFPYSGPAEFKAKPALCGIPFLAPWANRLDQDAFWANGKKYLLNPDLGNLRRDPNGKAIHGLLAFSPAWKIVELKAGASGAMLTSRLEFWRYPDLMAQFPFAHAVEMTYRLRGGALEVETVVENLSAAPIPIAIGYHPYFQVPGTPRDSWKVHLAAREHVELSADLIPTGARTPVDHPDPYPLAGTQLDDVFTSLVRDEDGRSRFWVQGGEAKISVVYGPHYNVAVVYAPAGRDFICFEPMAAVTNAFNLAQAGKYPELQSVPPGGRWHESFWVTPSGF
jgi:aldose 1-epimerase